MKHVETEENDENFDCCTIYDSAILKSMLDNLAICKYCRNELRFFSIFRIQNFECPNINLGYFLQCQWLPSKRDFFN